MAKLLSNAQLLQTTVKYKELSFKQYRQLLKCFIGDDIYSDTIFLNTDNILKELTDLTESQINNLSFLDYCLLLFEIRQTSIGNTVYLYVEDSDSKQIKINLSLYNVIEQITDIKLVELLTTETIDGCKVEYKMPSIKEIIILEKEKELFSPYTFFVKKLFLADITINFEELSFSEREKIIQSLPLKIMNTITSRAHAIIDFCNKLNLLSSIKSDLFNKELILTLNSDIIAFIIKLFYNTRLETLYEHMFILSKMANISCSFLDDCTPGEFYIFAKQLEALNAKSVTNQTPQTQRDILPPIHSEASFG